MLAASPLTSRYATSSSLALIAPHCFSLSLTLVHNSFCFPKHETIFQRCVLVCEVLGSVAHNNISHILFEQINSPVANFMRDFGKYKSYRVNQGKFKHLKAIAKSCKNSDVLGKRETFSNPRVSFFWESASWIESAGMWRVNIRQNWKDIALDIQALCALQHICVAFFALKCSLAGVEPVMFHQDLRQLGANGYSGRSFALRRWAKLFIAQ